MNRVTFSVAILACVTAFAPAPLPRSPRLADREVSLRTLQGKWRIVSLRRAHQGGTSAVPYFRYAEVTIDGNQWAFDRPFLLRGPYGEDEFPSLVIGIDPTRSPAAIDFSDPNGEQGRLALGIVRRDGDRAEVVFAFGDRARAASFSGPPVGHFVLKLRRQR